jgi:hypothetical protein
VRDLLRIALGGDEGGHVHQPNASLTRHAEHRIMPGTVLDGLVAQGVVAAYSA